MICSGVLSSTGGFGYPIALFIFDDNSDTINGFYSPFSLVSLVPFVKLIDFYMDADSMPNWLKSVPVVCKGRYSDKTQTVYVPNWASANDKIIVQFFDY